MSETLVLIDRRYSEKHSFELTGARPRPSTLAMPGWLLFFEYFGILKKNLLANTYIISNPPVVP